jgi:mono/diheme cytochrome c family protein
VTNEPTPHNREEADLVEMHEPLLREPNVPRQGTEALSPWLMVTFLAVAFAGAAYLFYNSGGFQSNVFNPSRVAWEGAGPGGAAAGPDPMVIGKKVFNQTCAVCHQASGLGVAGQFPPLADSEWVLSKDWHGDNHIVRIVLHGLQGTVTVKGQQYNNAMAPWGKTLKDEQIAAVLTYVRNEWGNKAPPIPKEFVAKIREETKDRTDPWTQKELEAIGKELVGEAEAAPAPEGAAAPEGAPAAPASEAAPAPQQ